MTRSVTSEFYKSLLIFYIHYNSKYIYILYFTCLFPHEVPRAAVCKTQSLSVEGSLQYIAVHIVDALPNSAPCQVYFVFSTLYLIRNQSLQNLINTIKVKKTNHTFFLCVHLIHFNSYISFMKCPWFKFNPGQQLGNCL